MPEWWDDELAEVAANRAMAEAFISRQLGFSLEELRDREDDLSLPWMVDALFKRYRNEVDTKVRASALLAQQVSRRIVGALVEELPQFERFTAKEIRETILRHRQYVDLESLLDFCWKAGVTVIPLVQVPGKRFDGLAAFIDGHPVIVLASGRDAPPWLAFHLAHELGHIMLEHVGSDRSFFDESLGKAETNLHEKDADAFACEVLTGFAKPMIGDRRAAAAPLAAHAAREGPEQGVDPGVWALIYARSNDRWGASQNALKFLDLDSGAKSLVAEKLEQRLSGEKFSEADSRLLQVLQPE